uniref:glycosyltransferase n=1 Tax=Halopseudomonas sp. TaxID=2901191 RepID=UPI003569C39E
MPWLSVVMPVRNEAAGIVQALAPLQGLRGQIEIIVVDGRSADGTVELAGPLADQVIESAPGRARQMNAGAALASGEVLLFLHADTHLPDGFEGMIRSAIPATHNVTPASHAVIPASHAVIPAKAGIHFDLQPTPSPEQDSSAYLNPTMDPRVREDDGREESVIPAKAGIHSDLQPTPSPEQGSSAHLNPTMDPRVREDDGREESVIPAEAGIHSGLQPTPSPERDSSAHLNPTMDPRVREDDGREESVIPAEAGIHSDPQPTPGPER